MLDGHAGFQPPNDAQETYAAHEPLFCEPRQFEWLCGNDFEIPAEPCNRWIWNHANNRSRDAIEGDASSNRLRIGVQAIAPEVCADQGDIGLHFFLGKEEPSENRTDAECLHIVRGFVGAVELNGIAHPGKNETSSGVRGETGENGLAIAEMPEARDRHGQLLQISFLRFRLNDDKPVRLGERQTSQEQIVDETENRRVHPDAERERYDGEERESGRLEELSNGEAKISHNN